MGQCMESRCKWTIAIRQTMINSIHFTFTEEGLGSMIYLKSKDILFNPNPVLRKTLSHYSDCLEKYFLIP